MTAYATAAELAVFMGAETPEDADRLLQRASELIDRYCRTAVYAVDAYGMPTDADDIEAFMKATCAQVEFWIAGDEEDDVLGPMESMTIGGLNAAPAAPLILAPRAEGILTLARLYSSEPVVW